LTNVQSLGVLMDDWTWIASTILPTPPPAKTTNTNSTASSTQKTNDYHTGMHGHWWCTTGYQLKNPAYIWTRTSVQRKLAMIYPV